MKKKTKAGGTRKAFKIPPFTLEDAKPPSLSALPDVAKARARELEKRADSFAKQGAQGKAEAARQEAEGWRGLPGIEGDDAAHVEALTRNEATEKIDMLLSRLQANKPESVTAAAELFCVVDYALAGLQGLAAGGNANAAGFLLSALTVAVERFERLAAVKPNLFQTKARAMFGIPAIVSRNPEQTEKNQQLAEKLQTGEDYPLAIVPKGGRHWRHTPANALAERLVQYIWQNRELHLFRARFEAEIWDAEKIPVWLADALKLKPFAGDTCQSWAEVAWQVILSETKGTPESKPTLRILGESAAKKKPKYCKTLHPATQRGNIRAKIKERICDAMKQIARKE